jgi:exonuclease SbcD
MERLQRRFPGTLSLQFDGPTPLAQARSYAGRWRQRDDLEVCCDFLEHVRGGAGADDSERALLAEAVEESRRDRRRRDDEGRAAGSSSETGANAGSDPRGRGVA